MGALDGKVAFITGAARGQGRSHAVRLAEEGADIIAVDICAQMPTVAYAMSTPEDLTATVSMVEQLDRRIHARQADVRDFSQLKAVLDEGVAEFGRLDIVVANAGIAPMGGAGQDVETVWQDVIDVNLTGVWNTVRAAAPVMIEGGRGGSIIITSSTAGLKGLAGGTDSGLAYTASKHGVVGIMRGLATHLAPHWIRVNTVHPTGVDTPMINNEIMASFLAENSAAGAFMSNALPVDMVQPVDISNAIVWLASDAARYVTGVTLPVDAGYTVR